jgi:hypothetical protein
VATHSLVAGVETSPSDTKNCSIKVFSANSKSVIVHYATMPDNIPPTNHDKFFIWQGPEPRVPYAIKPLKTLDFDGSAPQEGKAVLKPLSLGTDKSYCIGLAVGPDVKDTVAACFLLFPGGGGPVKIGQTVAAFFIFESASSDTVQVHLKTPEGYKAKTWGAVARLFEGEVAPLSKGDTIAELTFDSDDAQNPVTFSGLSLAAGYHYTVGFYTNAADDQWTTLGASVTFMI